MRPCCMSQMVSRKLHVQRVADQRLPAGVMSLVLHVIIGVHDVLLASKRAALLSGTRAGAADGEGANLWARREACCSRHVDWPRLRSALLARQRASRRHGVDTRRGDRRSVRDHLWVGDGRADRLLRRLACFGKGIVARVKVLALLELVLEQILLGQLAVQTEELLLLFVQRRDVDLVRWAGIIAEGGEIE